MIQKKSLKALKVLPRIKLLCKCYGAHNIIAVLVCEKGCEGETITNLRQLLSKLRTRTYHISIGFEWDKIEISPY